MDLDLPVDPNEPTYCFCNQVSYGEMVACDNPDVCYLSLSLSLSLSLYIYIYIYIYITFSIHDLMKAPASFNSAKLNGSILVVLV
jgi:hypothetical protein